MRADDRLGATLWPSIYLSAITQAVRFFQQEDHREKAWTKTITQQLQAKDIDLSDLELIADNAHRHAQTLMELPLNRITAQQDTQGETE